MSKTNGELLVQRDKVSIIRAFRPVQATRVTKRLLRNEIRSKISHGFNRGTPIFRAAPSPLLDDAATSANKPGNSFRRGIYKRTRYPMKGCCPLLPRRRFRSLPFQDGDR